MIYCRSAATPIDSDFDVSGDHGVAVTCGLSESDYDMKTEHHTNVLLQFAPSQRTSG